MTKHTPGQWTWVKEQLDSGLAEYIVLKAGEDYVLSPRATHAGETWVRVRNDDATLIAEAPALVEALEGIKWKSADKDNMEFAARITYVQMDKIRAVLKRVYGEKG